MNSWDQEHKEATYEDREVGSKKNFKKVGGKLLSSTLGSFLKENLKILCRYFIDNRK